MHVNILSWERFFGIIRCILL